MPVPPHLFRPEIYPGNEFILEAFYELTHDRQLGFGSIGPIPFTSIDAFAKRFGIPDEEFVGFKNLIRAADNAFRDGMQKKIENNRTNG